MTEPGHNSGATRERFKDLILRIEHLNDEKDAIGEDIKEVFSEHGFPNVADELNGEYRKIGYCVQYRETDFNFVSRLMEQEGIYYFFTHENGKHTLIMADSSSAHEPGKDYETIPYYPRDEGARLVLDRA